MFARIGPRFFNQHGAVKYAQPLHTGAALSHQAVLDMANQVKRQSMVVFNKGAEGPGASFIPLNVDGPKAQLINTAKGFASQEINPNNLNLDEVVKLRHRDGDRWFCTQKFSVGDGFQPIGLVRKDHLLDNKFVQIVSHRFLAVVRRLNSIRPDDWNLEIRLRYYNGGNDGGRLAEHRDLQSYTCVVPLLGSSRSGLEIWPAPIYDKNNKPFIVESTLLGSTFGSFAIFTGFNWHAIKDHVDERVALVLLVDRPGANV